MKLLLTSNGLSNEALKKEFLTMCGKKPSDVHVAFVTTASKVQKDTAYVENDLEILKDCGIGYVSQTDISDKTEHCEHVLFTADVIFVEGGNTFYLLDEFRKRKLDTTLIHFIKSKLYVGVSAGSILVTPTIAIANVDPPDNNFLGMTDFTGLSWVDFEVSPHTPCYVPLENVKEYAKQSTNDIYAYDDGVALKYVDGKIEFVGEGFQEIL